MDRTPRPKLLKPESEASRYHSRSAQAREIEDAKPKPYVPGKNEARENEVFDALSKGHSVQITEEEYRAWGRRKIQDRSGRYVDVGDGIRAQICLLEVQRLDTLFHFWDLTSQKFHGKIGAVEEPG